MTYTPAHMIRILRHGVTPEGKRFTDVRDERKGTTSRLHGHLRPIAAALELSEFRRKVQC